MSANWWTDLQKLLIVVTQLGSAPPNHFPPYSASVLYHIPGERVISLPTLSLLHNLSSLVQLTGQTLWMEESSLLAIAEI